ncbi:hypothetical protein F5Y13DRAFT_182007 [Hypoxylon sp. FL1857]|nr:hypothetical protein F5Y13DRAFT_182007 [Hypoxylon sp. FL1857]
MDLLDELESMAQVATQQPTQDESEDATIKRWQSLFGYSFSQAAQKIKDHRSDLTRTLVTDSHWEMVRLKKEAQGFDKEAYEHSCTLAIHTSQGPRKISCNTKPLIYLLKLEGPFSNVEQVKAAADLNKAPPELNGTDDSGEAATFCKVDAGVKERLLEYLSRQGSPFQPTFIRYSKAEKDLSRYSAYPTLGIDTTMPQNRLNSVSNSLKLAPAQDEYPVWYFFYGTLGDTAVLKRLLDFEPTYRPASVAGGTLKTWGGKYKALVDAFDNRAVVKGQAYLVKTKAHEECLQLYETDKYEVVRCEIRLEGEETVRGLTFRFVGDIDW